jgi:hypothetical protein
MSSAPRKHGKSGPRKPASGGKPYVPHVVRVDYPEGHICAPWNFNLDLARKDKARKASLPPADLATEENSRPAMHASIVQQISTLLVESGLTQDAQAIYDGPVFPKKTSTVMLAKLMMDINAIRAFIFETIYGREYPVPPCAVPAPPAVASYKCDHCEMVMSANIALEHSCPSMRAALASSIEAQYNAICNKMMENAFMFLNR